MDENSRVIFLDRLAARKTELERALDSLQANLREYNERVSGDSNMDESDQAQREMSMVKHYRLIERSADELQKIAVLMRRISENRVFGECEECEETIPLERLLLVPGTTLCVDCQRECEKADSNRYPAGAPAYLMKRNMEKEFGDFEDDLDLPLIDPDLEIIAPVEFDEPEPPPAA